MNILPLKKWHVRRKENVERVRRDEAEARAKEEELKRRAEIAEREARLDLMKRRAKEREGDEEDPQPTSSSGTKNINFFADLEQGVGAQLTNAEHAAEKKAEQEKLEKRIGLLNYLVDKDKTETPWYSQSKPAEESAKSKQRKETMDPMNKMNDFLKKKRKADSLQDPPPKPSLLPPPTSSTRPPAVMGPPTVTKAHSSSEDALHKTHKHKKHKKLKRQSSREEEALKEEKRSQLEKLRAERRRREAGERTRVEAMLRTHYRSGEMGVASGGVGGAAEDNSSVVERPGRYFSQFNPHLARQHRNDH